MTDQYMTLVAECAAQGRALARKLANESTLEPLYLYCRKSTGQTAGRLFLIRDSAPIPADVELVTGEGLRADVPYDAFYQWVYDRAKRTPILSYVVRS